LPYALQGLEGFIGIAGEVEDQGGVRIALEVLHDADVEIGRDFLIFRGNFGLGILSR